MLAASTASRIDPKKRAVLDPRKQQFVKSQWATQDYGHRMNFYTIPPTDDIQLEEFEEWGIARLKVLAELEACQFRNRSPAETEEYMRPVLEKWLRLDSNRSRSTDVQMQRKKDHYSHWTLRLAFASTADLRQRFMRLETQLFKLRLQADNADERRDFIKSLPMSWEMLDAEEKNTWLSELRAATAVKKDDEENWFKVDWEKVPELVERRQVLLKKGKAYVHVREQMTMVLSEFTRSLESGLELAARFLPRMDEDNRLAPILHHLSQSFVAPDASYNENSGVSDIANIHAGSIDGLASHFPLCMQNLHRELRKNSHLKHQSRLQYTLFLKGIGLNMQECIVFWRKAFKLITDGTYLLPNMRKLPLNNEQKNSSPSISTISVTAMEMLVVMRTSVDVAIHHSAAKSFSQNHCLPLASTTAALTGRTLQITLYRSSRTWVCPTATYSVRSVKTSDVSATTLPATAFSSPRTRTRSKRYVPIVNKCRSLTTYANISKRSKMRTCGMRASSIPSCTPTNTSSAASCSRTSVLRVMAIWVLMGLVRDRTETRAEFCILLYTSEGVLRVY